MPYPLKDVRFGHSNPIVELKTVIFSAYDKRVTSLFNHDIIEMIDTFPPLMWLSITFCLVIFWFTLRFALKNVYGQKKTEAGWIVLTFFIGQDYLDEKTFFLQYLSILMSFFSFFLMSWLTNSMSTDMVTSADPLIVTNYQDILDQDRECYWMAGYEWTTEPFKNAAEGSIESKLWDKSSRNSQKGRFVPRDTLKGLEYLTAAIERGNVLMGTALEIEVVSNYACSLMRDPEIPLFNPDYNILQSEDPNGQVGSWSLVSNWRLDPVISSLLKNDEYIITWVHIMTFCYFFSLIQGSRGQLNRVSCLNS